MEVVKGNEAPGTSASAPMMLRVSSYARELSAPIEPHAPVLIGSGPNCEIRIDALPALHSVVTWDGVHPPQFCPISPVPPVMVNGKLRTGNQAEPIQLTSRETLHIGLRTIARLAMPAAQSQPATTKPESSPATTARRESQGIEPDSPERKRENLMNKDLNDLSAAELIELIEQEEHQVAEFETRQQSGLQKLLLAVKQVSHPEAEDVGPATIPLTRIEPATPQVAQAPIEQELHYLVEELSELVEDLCEQVQVFADTEAISSNGAQTTFKKLLREQHDILEKLDTIAELIGDSKATTPFHRKVA